MQKKQSHFFQSDLIILLILLIGVSLLAIYNAQQLQQYESENFVLKQTLWYIVGVLILMGLQMIDTDQFYRASLIIYAFTVFLLIVLWISPESIAREVNGAKSWFHLPGFTLQPSEFTKIGLIVYLSAIITKHKEKYKNASIQTDLRLLVKMGIVVGIPIMFTMVQPDMGTSLVYLFITGMLIILSGIDWKIIATMIVTLLVAAVTVVFIVVQFPSFAQEVLHIKPYQMGRVMTWFDHSQQTSNDTFHIDRSMQALGSGKLTGKGMDSLQVQLPEAQTDFIFSVIGESFGFIGTAAVVLLYFLLMYRLVTLGLEVYTKNPYGAFLCFGYMSLLLMHTFQNIGMTIGIMPITGIPLYFLSYGGSSVLAAMIGYGLIYRVAVENSIQKDYLFK